MTDPIADMIIRLKNAGEAHKETVSFSYSKLKFEICTILEKEGFVKSITKKGKKITKSIEVELIYNDKYPKIEGVKRVSKPSRRVYKKSGDLRPIKSGFGSLILSTPAGIVTGKTAKKNKIGGEALFEIW